MHPGSLALKAVFCLFLVLFAGVAPLGAIDEDEILAGPYLTNLRPTHVTVNYEVNRPVLGWVQFDTEGHFDSGWNYTHGYPPEDVLSDLHHITLPGLLDDERYYYSITLKDPNDNRDYGFFDYSLKTSPEKGQAEVSFRIGVYGDCYGNPTLLRRVSDDISSEDDMIAAFLVGDVLPPDYSETAWRDFFYGVESLGAEKAIFPLKGANEASGEAATAFDRYFPLIEGPLDTPKTFGYHSFDWGVLHLIVLDTLNMDEAQASWLEQDLQSSASAPYVLVFLHQPLEELDEGMAGRLEGLFAGQKVSVVFSGGDGDFRLEERSGVHYVNAGSLTQPAQESRPIPSEGNGLVLRDAIPYSSFQVGKEGDVWLEVISMGSLSPDGQVERDRKSVQKLQILPRNVP